MLSLSGNVHIKERMMMAEILHLDSETSVEEILNTLYKDAAVIIDKATFEDPHQYAVGVKFVLVNGEIVVEDGQHTGRHPGKIIYGPGYYDNN